MPRRVSYDESIENDDPNVPGPSTRVPKRKVLKPVQNARLSNSENEEQENDFNNMREQRLNNDRPKILIQHLLSACGKKGHIREDQLRVIIGKGSKVDVREEVLRQSMTLAKDVLGIKIISSNNKYHAFSTLNLDKNAVLVYDSEPDQDFDDELRKIVKKDQAKNDEKKGIILVLLTFMFMVKKDIATEPGVEESSLIEFISDLTKDKNEKEFENKLKPEGALTKELESQGWLKLTKTRNINDEETIYYDWGLLALNSIDPFTCLDFFLQTYGGSLEDWPAKVETANAQRRQYGFSAFRAQASSDLNAPSI